MEIRSKLLPLVLIILVLPVFYSSNVDAISDVTFLKPGGELIHVIPEMGKFGYTLERMRIYCYEGNSKEFSHLLRTITLNVEIDDDDFNCFEGYSPADVRQAHDSHRSFFSFNIFSRNKKRIMKLNPFNQSCIGLETANEYQVHLQVIRLDLIKLLLLVGGTVMFFSATKLSRNAAFFYISGILVGIFASVLVLIWFMSKLLPKKPLMYGMLASGWTLAFYLAQIIVDNIQTILITYQSYVLGYILTTGCVSFVVCYYMGPPKNERSKDLIMWGLQLFGLLGIYMSSELREATIGIMVGCIVLYYFPLGIFGGLRRFWYRRFPPKRTLLTKEEFEEQGQRETEKALKELRQYVKSPECKHWKVVSKLREPSRFASFVEGDSHVTQNETKFYEDTLHMMELSDDEDSSDGLVEGSLQVDESLQVIDKSKINGIQRNTNSKNKTSQSYKIVNSTPIIASNRSRIRQQNGSRIIQNDFDISDDED